MLLREYHRRLDITDEASKNVAESELIAGIKESKECNQAAGITALEVPEMLSDVGGAFALSNYLKDYPPKTEADAFGALGLFMLAACSSEHIYSMSPAEVLEQVHPRSVRRVERIFLKFPGIARHFDGCRLSNPNNCFKSYEFVDTQKPRGQIPSTKTEKVQQ